MREPRSGLHRIKSEEVHFQDESPEDYQVNETETQVQNDKDTFWSTPDSFTYAKEERSEGIVDWPKKLLKPIFTYLFIIILIIKGQLISEWFFGVFNSPKKGTGFFDRFLP